MPANEADVVENGVVGVVVDDDDDDDCGGGGGGAVSIDTVADVGAVANNDAFKLSGVTGVTCGSGAKLDVVDTGAETDDDVEE
jgi:hypothetical protein